MPILITLPVTVPILALGTWIYLRRRTLSPRARIVLAWVLFLFVLFAGPAVYLIWERKGISRYIVSTGPAAGLRFLNEFALLWLVGVIGVGVQLFRLCRRKGKL